MTLNEILLKKRDAIQAHWFDAALDSYPADSRRFLSKQKDQFANPVGSTLSTELNNLIDCLLGDADPGRMLSALDGIVRVRATQEFDPSNGLSFLFAIKKIARDVAAKEVPDAGLSEELIAFNNRVDHMMLVAFDVYMQCKETIYELKASQMKNQVSGLLRKTGLVSEIPPWDSAPEGGNKK